MLDRIKEEFAAHDPRPPGAPLALRGIKIVEFAHFLAGPFGTMLLADMGAEVIKIEPPGRGDEMRHYPPQPSGSDGIGAPFVWCNRNKRSIAVDLKTEDGLEIARHLIANADVIVENYSTGVMDRLGLGYEICRKLNPKIIYCAVSSYGRKGKFADRMGFDPVVQAESGFLSLNGYSDREGVRTRSPVIDISTGMMVSNAILGALFARERSSEGQAIEVSLIENAVLMTGYIPIQYVFTGDEPQRHGNTSSESCPSNVFRSADKAFFVNCGNDGIFHRLVEHVLESPELAADPAWADRKSRMARQKELFSILDTAFSERPWAYWQPRMRAASIPCGEVRTVGEALRSEEVRERKIVSRIPHADLGWLPNIKSPINYSGTPMADPVAAPLLGEHTVEVLRDTLQYGDERIRSLRQRGVVHGRDKKEEGSHPLDR
ncbi:CaiB/BaiF CoA transferase family protein [Achromobacter aegrifaciens]